MSILLPERMTLKVKKEAVDFRQAVARAHKRPQDSDGWFFEPWNAEQVKDPTTGKTYAFEQAPTNLLVNEQDCWRLRPEDTLHGFADRKDHRCMLDPMKVSLLPPAMGDNINLLDEGVSAELFTAYAGCAGILPPRTTGLQGRFLFSISTTMGKWARLINTLLSFKRAYDSNAPLTEVLPEVVKAHPVRYGSMGLKNPGG